MGDRRRLVIPAQLRARSGISKGTRLSLLETDRGLVMVTKEQLRELVRADLAGLALVGELLGERRAVAATENRS